MVYKSPLLDKMAQLILKAIEKIAPRLDKK